jgi:hypothetical protein
MSNGCGDENCKCSYCNNDNYDRYISDHFREIVDNINRFLVHPLNRNDFHDEEIFSTQVMYNAQEELRDNNLKNNK